MKYFLVFIFFIISQAVQAQIPEALSWQGVVRDDQGTPLVNRNNLNLKFSLLQAGDTLYQEIHEDASSNLLGLLTLGIGRGTPILCATCLPFRKIDWAAGDMRLQVELDANGGLNFQPMGENELLSVPYALASKKANHLLPKYTGENSYSLPASGAVATLQASWTWPQNGHIYLLFTTDTITINWLEAQELARKAGGHLLTVTSEAENNFVLNTLLSRPDAQGAVPLGFSDVADEGKWVWVTGEFGAAQSGARDQFTFWSSPQPDNAAMVEHVAHYWSTQSNVARHWNDLDAKIRFYLAIIVELSHNLSP